MSKMKIPNDDEKYIQFFTDWLSPHGFRMKVRPFHRFCYYLACRVEWDLFKKNVATNQEYMWTYENE